MIDSARDQDVLVFEMPEGVSAGKAEEVVHVRLGSLDVSMTSKLSAHFPSSNHFFKSRYGSKT
jgi:hypothetical protein